MTGKEAQKLIERLRKIDHPDVQDLADELEGGVRGRGRPADPEEKVRRWMERACMSEAFYNGRVRVLPDDECIAERAKGSWLQSDDLTAEELGVRSRSVRAARAWKPETREEMLAALRAFGIEVVRASEIPKDDETAE